MVKLESERLMIYSIGDDELRSLIEKETSEELKQAYSEMLQGCMDHPENRIWYTVWMIELKDEPGTIAGNLSFKGLNPDGMVEIGYGLNDGFCGKGYMSEAVKAVCEWAMAQDGVTRIEAETTTENRDSQRVLQHAGFTPTGDIGKEGPRFLYTCHGKYRYGYEILECKPTGSGYDLKRTFLIDGEKRYVYYSEMPDRCYIRGWSMYEISAANYESNECEPYIRYLGSISGENDNRASYVVYRALKEGLYIKSEWDYCYGDIYLVEDLGIKTPLVEYETIEGNYFEAKLADGSTHYLYRDLHHIRTMDENDNFSVVRLYEIAEATFKTQIELNETDDIPAYVRFLGTIPGPGSYDSDWEDKKKEAIYKSLTQDVSIYPYIDDQNPVIRSGPCALHEPFEIAESVCDHDSNERYRYAIWKVLIDGKNVVYLLLVQAKDGNKTVNIYEIAETQLKNEYICYYKCSENEDLRRVWEIDDSPDRRENIFRHSNVYYYMIESDPKYGGIPLNEEKSAPAEYIRLVCTIPDKPDIFSEDFGKRMYDALVKPK